MGRISDTIIEITWEKLYTVVESLDMAAQERWLEKLQATLLNRYAFPKGITLQEAAMVIYDCCCEVNDRDGIIAYGAGKVAKREIPMLTDEISVLSIWDASSNESEIAGIPVMRPLSQPTTQRVVIFIADPSTCEDVRDELYKKGISNCIFYKNYLWLRKAKDKIPGISAVISKHTIDLLEELVGSYIVICHSSPEVLYSVVPVSNKYSKAFIKTAPFKEVIDNVFEYLQFDETAPEIIEAELTSFFIADYESASNWMINLELILENILRNGAKTKKRPLRFSGDMPYDPFAVVTLLIIIINATSDSDNQTALKLVSILHSNAPDNRVLIAVECYYLVSNGKYDKALLQARKTMHSWVNDYFTNELFYYIAVCCRGAIPVEEPLPMYDLSEYFCWSGINFAWCGQVDESNKKGVWGPCFRPIECAARPQGDFWTSDDWKEFRRSVTDGSFTYCQKNQCPNIVGGWLPRKADYENSVLAAVLNGDLESIPPLEELHFSYDNHCNLQCPSCRTEIITATREKSQCLNEIYQKDLKRYVKRAKHLCLSGSGEALLSQHSKNILCSLSPQEYPELEVELRTNMTVLNKRSWESLGEGRKVIRHIAASIDGAKKETFERLRKPAKWDTVLENLQFVKGLRDHGDIDMFEFHVVVQRDNINELYDIVMLAIDMHADCVTFSKMLNWRNMPQEEYDDKNPYWVDHPLHKKLETEMKRIEALREAIESGECEYIDHGRKLYINMHFRPDPNDTYSTIRTGKIKIR